MAISAAADVRVAGNLSLNLENEINRFRVGLGQLVEEIRSELTAAVIDPLAAATGEPQVLERATRAWFHDRLLSLLGWDLGIRGDVGQEVRVRANSTYFIDYVGVKSGPSVSPVWVLEAKAWGEPAIAPRVAEYSGRSISQLIVDGVQHVKGGGQRQTAPVIGIWHDHLEQVWKYVNAIQMGPGDEIPRAVLSSGEWMVIFNAPTRTFVGPGRVDESQFEVFGVDEYVRSGRRIFELLSRCCLADRILFALRLGQLGSYVDARSTYRVFYAVHVKYEVSGSELFARMPRILVYAAMVFQQIGGTPIAVVDDSPVELPNGGQATLGELRNHFELVQAHAAELLEECSAEMGRSLIVEDLGRFSGFASGGDLEGEDLRLVKPLGEAPDEWLLVTGRRTHFLRPSAPLRRWH